MTNNNHLVTKGITWSEKLSLFPRNIVHDQEVKMLTTVTSFIFYNNLFKGWIEIPELGLSRADLEHQPQTSVAEQ